MGTPKAVRTMVDVDHLWKTAWVLAGWTAGSQGFTALFCYSLTPSRLQHSQGLGWPSESKPMGDFCRA